MLRVSSSAGRTMVAGRSASAAMQCQRIAQTALATVRSMSTAATATSTPSAAQPQRRQRPVRSSEQVRVQPPPPAAASSAGPSAAAAAAGASSNGAASSSEGAPQSDPPASGPFQPFWLAGQRFLPPGWLDKQRGSDSLLEYEAKLRRDTRATLQAEDSGTAQGSQLQRPRTTQVAELQRLYDDVVRRELPQFDPLAPATQAPQLSPAERAAALVARLHAGTDGTADDPAQRSSVSFASYTSATHALLRLATENPTTLSTSTAPDALSTNVDTDPLYSLQLLQRYWTNIFSPASPFPRSYAPTLHWWAMMAAVHVLVGCAARNPPDSRVPLIRALLDRMRAQQLVPQLGVEGTSGSLYDYAIKHEAFFRALLYAAMRAPDQSFAATLLPQIVHLAHPHRVHSAPAGSEPQVLPPTSVAAANVVWKPIPRFVQVLLFEQFMANCCAHIFAQQDASAATDHAAAAAASRPLQLPQRLQREFARATLLSLFPDMGDMLELVTLERRQWSKLSPPSSSAAAAAAPAEPAPPSSAASVQDIVFHSFRCLSSTPLSLSIRHYNFLLHALAHMPSSHAAHGLVADCVTTVLREDAVQFDLGTVHILLQYCLRGYDGASAGQGNTIPADRAALLRVTLAQLHRLLSSQPASKWLSTDSDEQGPPLSLTPAAAQFLAHASHAQTRHANPRATPDQLAEALLRSHFHWMPLLRTAAAASAWNSVVVRHLAALGSWTQLRQFLDAHGGDLATEDMRAVMLCCSSPDLFSRADQWAHSSSAEEQHPTSEATASDDAATAAPLSETAAGADASSPAPAAASPSMSVSHTLLRWEDAKSRLPAGRRAWLGLPSLESGVAAGDSAFVAREMEAAKYVVYHSRKLQLEKGAAVDSPLVLPSLYAAPVLDLPAAVLAAPNFSTGWLLMCSAWAQHRGEEEAVQSIKRVLIIVAKAAWGNANWQEQADSSGAQQAAATSAPSLPTGSATAASKPDSGSTSTSTNPLVRGVLGWLDYASKALVSDLSTSVHVFAPAPSSTPLLDSREKFKLHPQLLQSLLYAFQFFPHYRTNSTQWLALFKQLEPHVFLFDLRQQNPMLVKLFQCVDQSGPFFDLLRDTNWRNWPALMADLARVWDPLDAHMQARGRLLLLFLVRHTCPASGAMPPPPPQGSDPRARAQVLIRPAHLVECVRPFLQRMESHGHAGEMREWIQVLDRPHPQLLVQFWEYIHFGVQKNGSVVVHLLKTKPATTRQQLQAMALLPIEDAVQWRTALRRNRKLPPTSAMLLQRAVASVTPERSES